MSKSSDMMKSRRRIASTTKSWGLDDGGRETTTRDGDAETGYGNRLHGEASESKGAVSSGRRPLRFQRLLLLIGVWTFGFIFGKRSANTSWFSSVGIEKSSHGDDQNEKRKLFLQHIQKARKDLDASKWETFTHRELKRYFGCAKLFETPRPIITRDEWRHFRDLYNQHVAEQPLHDTYKLGKEPFDSPVEGAVTPDKGRGLIAKRDITEGELIFTRSNNTIVFTTGHSWRMFVWHLGHAFPPDDIYSEGFACDIGAWSWTQRVPEDGPMQVVVDIDESSLVNQPSDGEDANIQCGRNDDEVCGMDYYATQDIKKGAEILCHYSDFSEPSWDDLGL